MGRAQMIQKVSEGDTLTADELAEAINALSEDDLLKLGAIETIKRSGTGFDQGELFHETVCRSLMGDRNCPRDVPIMAFFVQTMRSIASHDRKQRSRLQPMKDEGLPENSTAEDQVGENATQLNPEDALIQQQEVADINAIHDLFDGDAEAQMVLLGWQDDLRGAALREATGLDQAQLDYAIKRIRIKMRNAYPNGWIR